MRQEPDEGRTADASGFLRVPRAPAEMTVGGHEVVSVANLLHLTHNAVCVRGFDGVVAYLYRAAEALFRFPASEAVGRLSHELLRTVFPAPLQ